LTWILWDSHVARSGRAGDSWVAPTSSKSTVDLSHSPSSYSPHCILLTPSPTPHPHSDTQSPCTRHDMRDGDLVSCSRSRGRVATHRVDVREPSWRMWPTTSCSCYRHHSFLQPLLDSPSFRSPRPALTPGRKESRALKGPLGGLSRAPDRRPRVQGQRSRPQRR
jgi:hypothetical protein